VKPGTIVPGFQNLNFIKMKKSIQLAMSMFAVACLCMLYSFGTKKTAKPFSFVHYYLKDNTCSQRIPSTSGQEDCRENSLDVLYTLYASNWSLNTTNSASQGTGNYLSSIYFDTSDFSLQQALNEVWIYYNYNGTLPADGADIVVGTKHITIRRAIAVF
jgi:hypothetical protein